MQRMEDSKQLSIYDLQPGDIFAFDFFGVPHCGIYAPTPDGQGDIIHMYFEKERMGAIKSTLSKLLLEDRDVHIFRNKKLDGKAIAAQAEFWLNQGVEYDKLRLAESLYPTDEAPSEEDNILKYLLIAARRETLPIKLHEFPCPPASYLTNIGILMLLPDYNYGRLQSFIASCFVKYGMSDPERSKGMSCITFVTSCLAAVALKDEINPVNSETGWVSMKHSEEQASIDTLLTDEKLANFNIDRIRNKLTPALTKLDPRKTSPHEFYNILKTDKENWESIGTLDKTIVKPFDKQAYLQEQIDLAENIKISRQKFIDTFSEDVFNRNPERPQRHFTLFHEQPVITGSAATKQPNP